MRYGYRVRTKRGMLIECQTSFELRCILEILNEPLPRIEGEPHLPETRSAEATASEEGLQGAAVLHGEAAQVEALDDQSSAAVLDV